METLRIVHLLYMCLISSLYTSCSSKPQFWNAASRNVSLPNNFLIDEDNEVLVIAANNSVCHLSFDLTVFSNVRSAEPNSVDSMECLYSDARSQEECQNYHHVLLLPEGPGVINDIPLNKTVLTCGSNAYRPKCQYRRRTDLQVISDYSANNFCSVDLNTDTTSLWTSNNRLVSASKSIQTNRFGIRISDSPYTGQVAVATRPNDNFWINKAPDFVSMYEIGEHIYVFFREEAVEVTDSDKAIFSRVARVCKNDTGSNDPTFGSSVNVFTTFIKARISCSSGSGIPYHYNNIQDTFLVQSGSYDGSTNARHLYAVFSSAENGPVGSAVCVYKFHSDADDLGNVFKGNYKKTEGGSLVVVENFVDFSCEANSRTVDEARDIQLMESPVAQSNGPSPLLELSGYTFRKIVVDQVVDADGSRHEVMFVTAHKNDELFLIKGTYSLTDPGQNYHVISTTPLGKDTEVTRMTLHGNGTSAHIYIGTENGIYRVPTADCERLTDCCSCVSATDPYCTYDISSSSCAAVGSTDSNRTSLIQDLARGNSTLCVAAVNVAPSDSTNGCTTTNVQTTVEDGPTTDGNYFTGTIPTGNLVTNGVKSNKVDEHTWTIVGVVCGFIVGVVIGIIVMAFFHQRGFGFARRRKTTRRTRRRGSQLYDYDSGENGSKKKDNIANDKCRKSGDMGGKSGGASSNKKDEFLKNNHDLTSSGNHTTKGNDYTNMVSKVTPPHKFVLNPVPTTKGARAAETGAKFTKNAVGNKSTAAVGGASSVAPPTVTHKTKSTSTLWATTSYDRGMTSAAHSNPNIKSNIKLEESLTNHDREAYGRNILARQPSVDTSNKLAGANGRTRVHPAVLHVSYDRHRDFVSLSDVPRTCSQC